MKLLVTTPVAVVVDADDVAHVRAEDETGAFGILAGHADFVTALTVSVITWRDTKEREHHVAVRGGILRVRGGTSVEVVTREACGEDTLDRLGESVLAHLREEAAAEEVSRVSAERLHLAAIRQIERYLATGRRTMQSGPPPSPGPEETLSGQGDAQ